MHIGMQKVTWNINDFIPPLGGSYSYYTIRYAGASDVGIQDRMA